MEKPGNGGLKEVESDSFEGPEKETDQSQKSRETGVPGIGHLDASALAPSEESPQEAGKDIEGGQKDRWMKKEGSAPFPKGEIIGGAACPAGRAFQARPLDQFAGQDLVEVRVDPQGKRVVDPGGQKIKETEADDPERVNPVFFRISFHAVRCSRPHPLRFQPFPQRV